MIEIREARASEEREIENVLREAFWNHYAPGASEHYLARKIRESRNFISALHLVAVDNGNIIGTSLAVPSKIVGDDGKDHEVLTLGPIGILPSFQKKGIGKALLQRTKDIASSLAFSAILLTGDPDYYTKSGFLPAELYDIRNGENMYADYLLAFELHKGSLSASSGLYFENPIYESDEKEIQAFDSHFPPKELQSGTPGQKKLALMITRVRPKG